MKSITDQPCSHVSDVAPVDRPLKGNEKNLVEAMLSSLSRPDQTVESVVTGSKFTAISAGGRMGLASFLGARPRPGEMELAKRLKGKPVREAADLVRSASPWAISLGFAALNAANAMDPQTVNSNHYPAENLITELGKGKIVGLVGEFPFVQGLEKKVGTLHLFELRAVPNALPRDQWEDVLPGLDVLAVTGTALLTRKMAWYLTRATRATIVVLGPTTPISPALFDFGAHYLCGSVVTDPHKVAQGIAAGLPFKHIKKKGGVLFTQLQKKDLV